MCRIRGWHFHMHPHLTLPSAQRAGWWYQPHLTQKVTQRSDLGHGHKPTQGPDSKPLILSSMPPPSTPGEKISEENKQTLPQNYISDFQAGFIFSSSQCSHSRMTLVSPFTLGNCVPGRAVLITFSAVVMQLDDFK